MRQRARPISWLNGGSCCAGWCVLLQRASAPTEAAKLQINAANAAVVAAGNWFGWQAPWARLRLRHALLHIYLFVQVYEVEAAARNDVLASVKVLVAAASFIRKMLGCLSPWVKSFKDRTLKSVLVDEAHPDSFLQLSALLARAPRAALLEMGYKGVRRVMLNISTARSGSRRFQNKEPIGRRCGIQLVRKSIDTRFR